MKNIKKRGKIVFIFIFIIILAYGFYNGLTTTYYTYESKGLPKQFDGYKVVFLSDFHCKKEGNKESKLIDRIIGCKPDMVVFTGDMIDRRHQDLTPVNDLLAGLSGKYPMYAVSGNHETDDIVKYNKLLDYYKEYGVNFLDNSHDIISKEGAQIGIYGKAYRSYNFDVDFLQGPNKEESKFNILLYHDATAFPQISSLGFDLVLSGHTHGGIIRLPLIGGLINNRGTLIAEYENGIYERYGSTMISNRGIGDAVIPRFNNPSEVVCVTLKTAD